MANRFTQKFTLTDIFNDKNLRGKIPLINYKETEREDGKVSVRTNAKSVRQLVYDKARSSARPYYKPLEASKAGATIIISGNLVGSLDDAHNAVYEGIKNMRSLLVWTANNADMIRSALKEGEKNRRKYGTTSKLYLRAQSLTEIENMSEPQLRALINDIMENIFYGDDFTETKKKFGVESLPIKGGLTYEQRQQNWKRKVGDL